MRSLLAFLLLNAGAAGQALLEDMRCRAAAGAFNGNPTRIVCTQPHNFGGRYAISRLIVSTATAAGNTVTIDGTVYTFRTSIDNTAAREVLIGANAAATATNLYHAVNDTGTGKGTLYSNTTTAHPTCVAYKPGASTLFVRFASAGPAGIGKPVTSTGPSAWSPTSLQIQWYVRITGATGSWAGIGSDATPRVWTATYVSDTDFTVPFNSTSAGSFAGQSLLIRRASGDGFLFSYSQPTVQGDITDYITDEGTLAVDVPTCPAGSTEAECSRGYWSPDNQKAYMVDQKIQSLAVSGGVATITLTAPFPDGSASGFELLDPGRLIHIRGLQQYVTATNPGYNGTPNAPPQPEAANMAKNSTRGYRVQTLSPDKRVLTIATSLADGVYLPSCQPAGACIGRTQPEGFIAITWRASPYLYFRSRETSGYLYPASYMPFHVKSGEFHPLSNRLRFWVKWGVDNPRSASGGLDINLGTYPQTTTQDTLGSGAHYYHFLNFSSYSGVWQKVEFNGAPSHQVGASGGILWPNEPLRGQIFYPAWPGGPRSYMEGLTIFYLDAVAYKGPWDGQTMHIANLEFDAVMNEPEDLVRGRSILYSPKRFLGSTLSDDPGYEVSWEAPPLPGLSYEVRYSTSASLKTSGFSSGVGSTIVNPPGLNLLVTGSWWLSPAMSQQPDFWAAIRPRVPIGAASGAGHSPIWVVTRADLGVSAGDLVTIENVGGNTAANQTSTPVVNVMPRRFWWRFTPQPAGNWTIPGKLLGITAATGVCTAAFTEPHGLVPGWLIEVQGSTNVALGAIPASTPKLYRVSSAPSDSSIQFNCAGVPNGTYDTDYSSAVHLAIQAFPGIAVAGTGDGNWTSGGTIWSVDEFKNFAEVHYSPYSTSGTPGTPPDAPASLIATTASSTAINLQWTDNAANEASFRIERKTGAAGTYTEIATVGPNITTFSSVGLTPSTTYFFRVRASNATGNSAYSNEASAFTSSSLPAPNAPTLLTAVETLNDRVKLTWQDNSSNESSFVLEADSGSGFTTLATVAAGVTSYDTALSGLLLPNHSYTFRVQAVNASGSSTYSVVSTTTLSTLAARVVGKPASNAALVAFQAPDLTPCQIRNGAVSYDETETGGVRSRIRIIDGLVEDTAYSLTLKCGSISAVTLSFATSSLGTEATSVPVGAARPAMAGSADNFIVDYGPAPDNLNQHQTLACSGSFCSTSLTYAANSLVWVRRRWCSNRATDPNCAAPGNELARSLTEAVLVDSTGVTTGNFLDNLVF